MFLKLQNNKMLNMKYLQDVFQGFHDKKVVVFYLVNGSKFVETYLAESNAEDRVTEVRELMKSGGGLCQKETLDEFPEHGSTGTIYIAKDTGQTYYWDKNTEQYVETGISGRTGVYTYNNALPSTVGSRTVINKSELSEALPAAVDYMNGSEVIGNNNVRALIVDSNENTVTVKTIVDLTIESFRQVATLNDLPQVGSHETLYFVKATDKLYSYDNTENRYITYDSSEQVDDKIAVAPTFKPFPSTFNTRGTTQQFLNSIQNQHIAAGSFYLGQVRLNDMPQGVTVQAEVEVYVYPQNVIYCIMRSAEISPYVWEVNSFSYNSNVGWIPRDKTAKDYADTNFLKKDNTTAYTPSANYHPATKKYVDDTVASEANLRTAADTALSGRITTLEGDISDIDTLIDDIEELLDRINDDGTVPAPEAAEIEDILDEVISDENE